MSKARSPIPDGFHTITPYLVVKNAGEAIEFYKRAFGAREAYRSTCEKSGRVMNAQLRIGSSMIMLNDEFPEHGCLGPAPETNSPVTIHLYVDDAEGVFRQAVRAGAVTVMPLTDMFWGDRFGQLRDPFGHTWSIASRIEDLSPEEIKERSKAAFV
jgi:uncharacterized glyoxalase superfamily protein PhnB